MGILLKIAALLYILTTKTYNIRMINWYMHLLGRHGYTVGYHYARGWIVYPIPNPYESGK
jgi:hypothetical protein